MIYLVFRQVFLFGVCVSLVRVAASECPKLADFLMVNIAEHAQYMPSRQGQTVEFFIMESDKASASLI